MYKGAKIAAVVTAYNESKLIGRVITTMPDYVDFIVIVDDCSQDNTVDVVRSYNDPRVHLVLHEINQGSGAAVMTAHKKAIELGSDINVGMAGDAQMDPAYLPKLLDQVTSGGFGLAKANRFYSPESFHGMPGYRVFGNIVLSFMTKVSSGYWHLFDPQNGYVATRTTFLKLVPFDRLSKRYSFENSLLLHLNILNVSAVDVPIPAVYGEEVSGIKLRKVIPELLSMLFKGFWTRIWYKYVLWSFSPVALMLILGLISFVGGLAVTIWLTISQGQGGGSPTAGTVMLAALPLMIGTQLLVSGLQLDIAASPSKPDQPPYE